MKTKNLVSVLILAALLTILPWIEANAVIKLHINRAIYLIGKMTHSVKEGVIPKHSYRELKTSSVDLNNNISGTEKKIWETCIYSKYDSTKITLEQIEKSASKLRARYRMITEKYYILKLEDPIMLSGVYAEIKFNLNQNPPISHKDIEIISVEEELQGFKISFIKDKDFDKSNIIRVNYGLDQTEGIIFEMGIEGDFPDDLKKSVLSVFKDDLIKIK